MSNEMPATDAVENKGVEQDKETVKGRHIFTCYLFRTNTGSGVTFSEEPPPPPPEPVRRPARVARMLALAHRLQLAIDSGEIQDRAALARRYKLTRARITQLLNRVISARVLNFKKDQKSWGLGGG